MYPDTWWSENGISVPEKEYVWSSCLWRVFLWPAASPLHVAHRLALLPTAMEGTLNAGDAAHTFSLSV